MSPPLDCEVHRAKDCGSFIHLQNPLNSSVSSRYSAKAGWPVLRLVGHPLVSFALLIRNMSFPLNVCDFHCTLWSFDLRFLRKSERSHRLMPGLQKSLCVWVSCVTVTHSWLCSWHPHPTLMLYFHSSSFPFWSTHEGEKTSSYYYICSCQILC